MIQAESLMRINSRWGQLSKTCMLNCERRKKGWYLRPHEDKFQMGTTFQKFSECIDQSLEILGRN
jgi:hypothetical protein